MRNPIDALLVALSLAGCVVGGSNAHAAAPTATKAKPITMEQAEAIALERVPGGVVEDIERDRVRGKLVFEIEVRAPDGREHELVIDAADGRVLSEEIGD